MRPAPITTLLALLLALTIARPASAADICWDALAPSSGGDWTTGANWAGGVAPGDGDTAVLDTTSATCSAPATVKVSGDVSVGQVRQGAGTDLMVDGGNASHGLTLAGSASFAQVLGDVTVTNGGVLKVAAGANAYAGGSITSAGGSGALVVAGTLRTLTSQFDVDGASISILASGSLIITGGTAATLSGQLDNDGSVLVSDPPPLGADLGSSLTIHAAATAQVSTGKFLVAPLSTLRLLPTKGTTLSIGGSGAIAGQDSGHGALELGSSPGPSGLGTVSLGPGSSLEAGKLTIGGDAALSLAGSGSATSLTMAAGDGRREGAGPLTVGSAQLQGGHLAAGTTTVVGQTTVTGGATTPAVHDGATLHTHGPTTWTSGNVVLGGTGTGQARWQNSGTLTIGGAPGLVAQGGAGLLENLAAGTLRRDAPGAMVATAPIQNAGSVEVLAGSIGSTAALPADVADFVQTGGTTTVAAGASLGMDVTLAGGTLRGGGSVRTLLNGGGTLAPGSSPGALSVEGSFEQGAGGTLVAEIAGSALGDYDRLVVGGEATLGGALSIVTAPGYAPPGHGAFRILQAGSRSGTFATVTGTQAAGGSYAAEYLADGALLCFACGPPGTHRLTVALSGAGSGAVTSVPAGISCGADCAADLTDGTTVTLTATPAPGSNFVGWSGICQGLGPCAVTMSEPREITATFAPEPPPEPGSGGVTAGGATTGGGAATGGGNPPAKSAGGANAPSVSGLVVLPSAAGCLRSASMQVRLRVPGGVTATQARLTVSGRGATTVRGAKLARPIALKRLPRGRRFTVAVAVTLRDGRVARASRAYRVCRAS